MRVDQLLRAAPAQNLCIFCTCRVLGYNSSARTLRTSAREHRRTVSTSRRLPEQYVHAVASSRGNVDSEHASDRTTQAHAAHLNPRSREQELHWTHRYGQDQRWRHDERSVALIQQDGGRRAYSTANETPRVNVRKHASKAPAAHRSDGGQFAHAGRRRSEPEAKASVVRRSNEGPFANSRRTARPVLQPERVAIPSFGSSTKDAGEEEGPKKSGWGFGKTERAPVQYGTLDSAPQHESRERDKLAGDGLGLFRKTDQGAGANATPSPDLKTPSPVSQRTQAQSLDNPKKILAANSNSNQPQAPSASVASPNQWTFRPNFPQRQRETPKVNGIQSISNTLSELDRKVSSRQSTSEVSAKATDLSSENPKTAPQSTTRDTDNWQHLKRREPQSETRNSTDVQFDSNGESLDADWVDRHFDSYRKQREQNAAFGRQQPKLQQSTSSAGTPSLNTSTDKQSAKCGRCGELGHTARQCKGTKCSACGQVGHLARQCTTKCFRCGEVGHLARDCPKEAQRPNRGSHADALHSRSIFRNRQPDRSDSRAVFANNERDGQAWDATSKQSMDTAVRPSSMKGKERFAVDNDIEETELPRRPRFAAEEDEEGEELTDQRPDRARKDKTSRRRRQSDEDEESDGKGRSRRGQDRFEDSEDFASNARELRKAAKQAKKAQKDAQSRAEKLAQRREQATKISLPEFVSVSNLAQQLGVRYENFVKRLERLGYDDVFPGKILNTETSGMIAMEYDFEPVFETTADSESARDLKARPEPDDKTSLPSRPPVVTIMGHVDHGKTTILDYLRSASVAAGEAGGITQHIGAFSVPLSSGKTITFLDTPGHAAFLAMRQRGANVTDIVILVVAADDSVKPQTIEAIKHAQGAGVPIIVAINKIDKDEADVQRVKNDLARHGVEIEDFGGDTQVVLVSGKTGKGMDELEEAAVTLGEILDHRAETDGSVEGWVLEATTKKAGRVATVLVRRGTLKPGTIVVAGKTWAKVRSLRNEGGIEVSEAGPGMPVEVDGWRDQPSAGDEVLQAPSEQKATSVVEYRLEQDERERTALDMEAINEARRLEQEKREREKAAERAQKSGEEVADVVKPSAPQSSGHMEVPFIIKADVSGSAEAVSAYIMSVSSPLISPRILQSAVGPVHESDIELASAAEGHIIAFNLPADEGAKGQAESRGVKILENNIIYRVLDDVKAVLEDKLPPVVTQKVLGEAEVGTVFEIGLGGRKKMKIAGCKVRNGVIGRGSRVRVTRGSEKIYDGTISSLKNIKKDVQEMRKGNECGMGFEGWEDFESGDQIQTYQETEEKRKL